ncbi:MAG: 50S ribosomal protein L15 [Candidatus Kerfeldbacteria bacterium RIFCSPHIGHO2_02_FULL_42_14]|uniref:Large ribosomal subunit protein uL15 n=1 Tax=Candidatus Kerfeldbacteria bacterium RIFCSPHIGHO2_02_FULL_42_14 TaxID=1798540 RepID=A0A1G2AS35_9BACT|nr:MAG: 50S ribosomal protein L15 [Candidatus Kerfeldbacteria bacterium RIFCSPHIGHO2_02_FULL_42_14]OGY80480.1 MAG: 50S ribosomal protein L15 [Candidatus Kerfeldbacteria bacterium RIFCSPHIGHO2_12_FULL_42_13]OGY83917.1 MAG: 50S ribosomal protein L15 [Candidatus Kerfeldbacteria bacterium RIFCSPLOWO2_02_FULL_42_19]OGY85330.1 MAG: 50S ribosomal protein L15 [Candidatus Kerfeldbacteria bacterium RIFCSPLOWO2_12_FULL_43_9]
MTLHNLPALQGRKKKRVGRGPGSGRGTYSGRGIKGQKARTGGRVGLRRKGVKQFITKLKKIKGFTSLKAKMLTVNVGTLNTAFKDGSHVDPQKLVQKGIIKTVKFGVKILGDGELGKKLNVKAHSFSRSAKAAILKQGGKVEIISLKQK